MTFLAIPSYFHSFEGFNINVNSTKFTLVLKKCPRRLWRRGLNYTD